MKIYYKNTVNSENLGYDLYFSENFVIPAGEKMFLKFGVACEVTVEGDSVGYLLVPRSSIVKTSLLMANSIGVIDAGYRNEIMAVVYNYGQSSVTLKKGERLFQLIPLNNGKPFDTVQVVQDLSSSQRGLGGFGSTGK